MLAKTPLLLAHLLGLSFSLGGVALLDLRMARLLRGDVVGERDLTLAGAVTPWVRTGLVLLWLSGFGLLALYWIEDPRLLANPKLHAKLVIVAALTANGVAIERCCLAHLRRNLGRALFDGVSRGRQASMLVFAAISATSWPSLLVLGVARELNFAVSAPVVLGAYAASAATAFAALWLGRCVVYRPAQAPQRPAPAPA